MNCIYQKLLLRTLLLLFEDVNGLVVGESNRFKFASQNTGLRILTSKTKYSCAGDIRVLDVPRNECTQCFGILTGATASAFMGQEFDAVNILENLGRAALLFQRWPGGKNPLRVAFAVCVYQLLDILLIGVAFYKAECLFERVLYRINITVFTKHQWYDKPVIGCTHLPIFAVISLESAPGELRYIGRRPGER